MAPRKPPTKKGKPPTKTTAPPRSAKVITRRISAESLSDQIIGLIDTQFNSLKGPDRMYYIHQVRDHVNTCHVIAQLETEERARANGVTLVPVPVEGENMVTVPGGGRPIQSDPNPMPDCPFNDQPMPTCVPESPPVTPAEVAVTTP